ncbi:MAG: hypothetical protein ACSHW6_11445, partial [Sulfitobacter geojensis]
MFPIRHMFIALMLGTLTLVPMGADASSDKAKDLARVEQKGLKSTGENRLNELLVQPAAAKG